jgi:hypothetical protein
MSKKSESKPPMTVASSVAGTTLITATTIAGGSTPVKPAKKKVTELECGEVRWFYLKSGENKWTPFKGKLNVV